MRFLAYFFYFPLLWGRRSSVERACYFFRLFPVSSGKCNRLLRRLGIGLGHNVTLRPPFQIENDIRLNLGDRVFVNYGLTVVGGGTVEIGERVLIGPNVTLATSTHPTDPAERLCRPAMTADIHIERYAWIGASVTICPGVVIGEGSVIAAGSVVTRSIPPHSVAAGVPCVVKRQLERQPSDGTGS